MSMNLKVEYSERFNDIVNAKINQMADTALQRVIIEAETICQQEAPVQTGTLRRSLGTLHPSICNVSLRAGVDYWRHVQYGTAAHTITGNPLLAWTGEDGERHVARQVSHPGSKANPFVTRTAKQIKSRQLIQQNLIDVLAAEGILSR